MLNTNHRESKSEAAQRIYPNVSFDCALPQAWVNAMLEHGHDVRPHFVWLYPAGLMCGRPGPITDQGVAMLSDVSMLAA